MTLLVKMFLLIVGVSWLIEDRHYLLVIGQFVDLVESWWHVLTGGPIVEMPKRYLWYLGDQIWLGIITFACAVLVFRELGKEFAAAIGMAIAATYFLGPFGFGLALVITPPWLLYKAYKRLTKKKPEKK